MCLTIHANQRIVIGLSKFILAMVMFTYHCININSSFKLDFEDKKSWKRLKDNLFGAHCFWCMNTVVSVEKVPLIEMNLSTSLSIGILVFFFQRCCEIEEFTPPFEICLTQWVCLQSTPKGVCNITPKGDTFYEFIVFKL